MAIIKVDYGEIGGVKSFKIYGTIAFNTNSSTFTLNDSYDFVTIIRWPATGQYDSMWYSSQELTDQSFYPKGSTINTKDSYGYTVTGSLSADGTTLQISRSSGSGFCLAAVGKFE